jgi:hypothetical protein
VHTPLTSRSLRRSEESLSFLPLGAEWLNALRHFAASEETPLDLAVQVAALMATVPPNNPSPDVAEICLQRLSDEQPSLCEIRR